MMTAEQLKASILQLAMEGKLVKQRADDKPIKPYIESLKIKQKKLIAHKIIKKEKLDSSIDEEIEVPDKWCVFKLGEITEVVTKQTGFDYSKTIKPNLSNVKLQGYIPFLQTKNFKGKTFDLNTDYYLPEEIAKGFPKILLDSECLLLSIVGASIGNVGIYDGKILAMLGGAICKVKLLDNELYNYLYYYLKSPIGQEEIKKNLKATAQGTITVQDVREVLIKLPPFEEQHRIIQKLEELKPFIAEYAAASEKLDKLNAEFPDQVKKSILQMAVEGKLVEQRPEEGTGEELFQKIHEEKAKLIKEGKIKKQKPLAEITDEEKPFDIPESWKWVRLGDIIVDTEAGKSPQCSNKPSKAGEWGVIKTTAIQDGYFLASENKVLPINFPVQAHQVVHEGDLLITRAGPKNRTGVVCVVDKEPSKLILSDKTVRLKYIDKLTNPYYLMAMLASPKIQDEVIASMSGMAASQVNISQNKMKEYFVPLPPIAEQNRIVARLNQVLPDIKLLTI